MLRKDIVTILFFFSSRRRHTRFDCDWSSDVCSSDLNIQSPVFISGTKMLPSRTTAPHANGALRCPSESTVNRSEEHTSELQSQSNLVCRLLLEKKKKSNHNFFQTGSVCASIS